MTRTTIRSTDRFPSSAVVCVSARTVPIHSRPPRPPHPRPRPHPHSPRVQVLRFDHACVYCPLQQVHQGSLRPASLHVFTHINMSKKSEVHKSCCLPRLYPTKSSRFHSPVPMPSNENPITLQRHQEKRLCRKAQHYRNLELYLARYFLSSTRFIINTPCPWFPSFSFPLDNRWSACPT